jgi:molecular chaperone DnaK
MKNGRICGIDLGLTHSCIAYADRYGGACVLPNTEGEMTTPSVVYFESKDNIVVGLAAKEAAWSKPDSCVSLIRQEIGNPHWEREFYGKIYRPQDVTSLI